MQITLLFFTFLQQCNDKKHLRKGNDERLIQHPFETPLANISLHIRNQNVLKTLQDPRVSVTSKIHLLMKNNSEIHPLNLDPFDEFSAFIHTKQT